jgi:hypothetical protein
MATRDLRKTEDRPAVLANQLTTVEDLIIFKNELIAEIKKLISIPAGPPVKRWLKSFEVKEFLHISTGTLHNLRTNGVIPFSKIGGVVFYDIFAVQQLLEDSTTYQKRENLKVDS